MRPCPLRGGQPLDAAFVLRGTLSGTASLLPRLARMRIPYRAGPRSALAPASQERGPAFNSVKTGPLQWCSE
jgi:hypothetical protein